MPPCRTLLPLLLLLPYAAFFIVNRTFINPATTTTTSAQLPLRYSLAPDFRDAKSCPKLQFHRFRIPCDPANVHIAMTLDVSYFRGSVAAIHSILKHTSCPSLIFFHFVASEDSSTILRHTLVSSFPSLKFQIHTLPTNNLTLLITPALRAALDNPFNYARNYLAHLLPLCVRRIVYLDSDLIVVDDIRQLWLSPNLEPAVIAAPEYCQADFNRYFTSAFWSDGGGKVFEGRRRRPCYFNTGVMVMDMMRWREGGYTERIEGWMRRQMERRIYELGSLPPFLLVFAGDIEAVDQRWNQHGLGGDNMAGNCRELHPGRVSLLHWSGKGKPWDRLDAGKPCSVDLVWSSYDLFIPS